MEKEVIILAGGLGTRLRSVVSDVPKCMAPVNGKPFLWYLFQSVALFDVKRVVLSVGYKREVIFQWIDKHGSEFPFSIEYAVEERPLGTGGGIRAALSKTTSQNVIVINGDTFYSIDLDIFEAHHRESGAAISLALKPMTCFDRYGTVEVENNCVTRFKEKAHYENGLINGGIYYINKEKLNLSQLPDAFSFEKDVLETQVGKQIVYGFTFDDYFIDIGVPEDYFKADEEFYSFDLLSVDISKYDTLLLDRDGVINRLIENDYVKSWSEFHFLPCVLAALKRFSKHFEHIFVVTNQRGVGKGVMTESDLQHIHSKMCDVISQNGGRVDKVYFCTALTDSDARRKPGRGMFDEILCDYPSVNPERCLMIGDSECDLLFAKNIGVDFLLLHKRQ